MFQHLNHPIGIEDLIKIPPQVPLLQLPAHNPRSRPFILDQGFKGEAEYREEKIKEQVGPGHRQYEHMPKPIIPDMLDYLPAGQHNSRWDNTQHGISGDVQASPESQSAFMEPTPPLRRRQTEQ